MCAGLFEKLARLRRVAGLAALLEINRAEIEERVRRVIRRGERLRVGLRRLVVQPLVAIQITERGLRLRETLRLGTDALEPFLDAAGIGVCAVALGKAEQQKHIRLERAGGHGVDETLVVEIADRLAEILPFVGGLREEEARLLFRFEIVADILEPLHGLGGLLAIERENAELQRRVVVGFFQRGGDGALLLFVVADDAAEILHDARVGALGLLRLTGLPVKIAENLVRLHAGRETEPLDVVVNLPVQPLDLRLRFAALPRENHHLIREQFPDARIVRVLLGERRDLRARARKILEPKRHRREAVFRGGLGFVVAGILRRLHERGPRQLVLLREEVAFAEQQIFHRHRRLRLPAHRVIEQLDRVLILPVLEQLRRPRPRTRLRAHVRNQVGKQQQKNQRSGGENSKSGRH